MATVTFIGDPRGGENPHACEMFGIAFHFNIPAEVEDAAIIAKLSRNSHFKVEGAASTTDEPEQPKRRRGRPPKVKQAIEDGPDQEQSC